MRALKVRSLEAMQLESGPHSMTLAPSPSWLTANISSFEISRSPRRLEVAAATSSKIEESVALPCGPSVTIGRTARRLAYPASPVCAAAIDAINRIAPGTDRGVAEIDAQR